MSVFTEALKKREVRAKAFDADGNEVQFDVRDDEEQASYLDQTVELLLAAGYFRARIKGLSPFDKVVGGMTWCIVSSNVEVDVDLLFQENSSIKEKIALTEKIVSALNRMKCPHRLEPYQIQGLDFIHIYPVVQWLVKTAIETKEEMNRQIRARAVFEFKKTNKTPDDIAHEQSLSSAVQSVVAIKTAYKPRRQFKPHNAGDVTPEARVTTTLLEYGRRYGLSRVPKTESASPQKNVAKALQGGAEDEDHVAAEETRINNLMSGMAETEEGAVSTAAVGSIVGMHTSAISQLSADYLAQQASLEAGESERQGDAAAHKRVMASLQKQLDVVSRKLTELQSQHEESFAQFKQSQAAYQEVAGAHQTMLAELQRLDELEGDEKNQAILAQLRSLVATHTMLEEQEKTFKANCKAEMNEWKEKTASFEVNGVVADDEHTKEVSDQLVEEESKLQKLRIQLAKRNRDIAALQRTLDSVPTRGELAQYQQRFLDLNMQSVATLREHKQFFALYNTQANKQTCTTQEVAFLNSIHDNFDRALQDKASKESFLTQLTSKVGAFKANREKAEDRVAKEKARNDALSQENSALIDQERLYYKTVMEYENECSRNEKLLARLKKRSGK